MGSKSRQLKKSKKRKFNFSNKSKSRKNTTLPNTSQKTTPEQSNKKNTSTTLKCGKTSTAPIQSPTTKPSPNKSNNSRSNISTRSNTTNTDDNNQSSIPSIHDGARIKTISTVAQNPDRYDVHKRICYCDPYEEPTDCKDCASLKRACAKHQLINCSGKNCYRKFHIGCLNKNVNKDKGYTCIQCEEQTKIQSVPWNAASTQQKAERLGMMTEFNRYSENYDPNFAEKNIRSDLY